GNGGTTHQVGVHRENILKVHAHGVVFFAEFEGRGGGGRRDNQVVLIENLVGFFFQKATHFLRFAVIGVVIFRAQYDSSQRNAPLHFRSEPFRPAHFVRALDVGGVRASVAVMDAVEPREVARSFGGGEQVVGGNEVVQPFEADGLHRVSLVFEGVDHFP